MKNKSICIKKQHLFAGIFLFIIVGCIIIISQAVTKTNTAYQSKASELQSSERIVGGSSVANAATWPFVVRIISSSPILGSQLCTGVLIDRQWVLTAAHCIRGMFGTVKSKDVIVEFGAHLLRQNNDIVFMNVSEIHSYYDAVRRSARPFADLALLKLEQAVSADTISLNTVTGNNLENENRMAVVLGWGDLDSVTHLLPNDLQYGILPLVSNQKANRADWTDGQVYDSEIVAGFAMGGVDVCSGDSGGPLVVWNGSKWIAVGIVKRRIGPLECGLPKKPGVYTRISFAGKQDQHNINYIEWIGDTIGNTRYNGVGTFRGSPLSDADLSRFENQMIQDDLWEINNINSSSSSSSR